ncbi:glycosyltransferase family 2 protein [Citrobacter freundii]|uniref:Glycosyltransferase family 2 protein n=1 Tax=Citrobacter freundii TaxID=546 RepID=A0AAE7GQN9_CITFR|nr:MULTISPECIES: glycosyltransferase family 2 protein [Citrobacter]MBA7728766.1 glycosyltransferase family 2 protein [Citrobacter freundii]MBD0829564.1 glycosyltransferase family 2 protein [Citrobacter sp. C1]QLO12811.1 glycosyltransferase family 2 protein [Citrobacter freundii]RFU92487.1 glycosyltransferase family 2 protein [Citrobacter gillenii]
MTSPLVSIIVTSYNHAQYLEEALESVYKQTWKNIEVIIVDDASTDNSQKIIKKYQKKHQCKTILREENYYSQHIKKGEKPIIQAMNLAQGKYIAVVDSDDLIMPTKISHQVNMMEKNTNCSMCYSAVQVIMPDGSIFPYNNIFLNGDVFEHMLITGNLSLYIGSLIRRDAYLRIERSPPDLVQEDWDMFLKLAKQGEFISSERVVAKYRRHNNNTWFRRDNSKLMYRNRMMILNQWKHEPAWVKAIDGRWKQYAHPDHTLLNKDIDDLLIDDPTDALLHYQGYLVALNHNNVNKITYHIVQAIIHCDSRLQILPELYRIALRHIDDQKIRELIILSIKSRLPDSYQTIINNLSQEH